LLIADKALITKKPPSAEQLKKRFPVVMRNRKLGVVEQKEGASAATGFSIKATL